MKKTRKSIIPFLLAIVMVVGLLPMSALAAEGESGAIQLNNISGKSFSVSQGVIKLFSPSESYEGTETIHSGTTWMQNGYREITWTIENGVGTLCFQGMYTLINALDFEGGNGLKNVVVKLNGATININPGAESAEGINEEYPTTKAIQANNVNLTFNGIGSNDDNDFTVRNASGFSENCPDNIYTIAVTGGDLTVDAGLHFNASNVAKQSDTVSATNIYVPDGDVTVSEGANFYAQSGATSAVGKNIYAGNTITLNGDCNISSYQETNSNSTLLTATAIKLGDGEITVRTSDSSAKTYSVEPTFLDDTKNYTIDTIDEDGVSKIIYTYTGTGIPESGSDTPSYVFPFTDVLTTDWFYDAVRYLSEYGITSGTSDTTFSPNMTLTRGQFITLIMRAYDISADENPTDNFSDAGNTYYTGYIAAAKRLKISDGIGDNMFAPDKPLTRQEMCKLLYNTLNLLDKLPENTSVKDASTFSDKNEVADWADESMTYFVGAGTIAGDNGKLMPRGTTTRAQMAQVLYRLLSK